MTSAPRPRHRHHVYVIELDDRVWNEARFRRANREYRLGKPFVYAGMTGLGPDVRFEKHKAGIRAEPLGHRLRSAPAAGSLRDLQPVPYVAAHEMEVELAIALHEAGYGVWQA